VSDNLVGVDAVVYRDLWKHIGKDLPKTAAGAAKLSAFDLPPMLRTALTTLYSHYAGEFERWERAGIGVPPVFIVVCQNTAISKLVFEWIAGFERGDAEEDEGAAFHAGHLELFRNYDDQGGRLARPRTLLIDSRQIETGDALDKGFRDAAGPEIEQFKRELAVREGAGGLQGEMSESWLLREVMNTVGRPGRRDIACTRASEGRILAVLDPYNPRGSTRHVNFITSKPCWKTGAQPPRSQISHVVLDSDWEERLAQTLETHPRVLAYAKNQALGFEIPYLDRGVTRRYLPDFLVRLDDSGDEPLNLVLEVKGIKDESDKAKAQTTRDLWVPGVNALGGFGRWAFAEFRDWAVMDEDFGTLVEKLIGSSE
jgi:hypothetical protein